MPLTRSYTVECGDRLRVGVLKTLACQGLCVGLLREAVLSPCNFATTHVTCSLRSDFLSPNFATHEMEDPFATPHTAMISA